jgi:hypothetical protein
MTDAILEARAAMLERCHLVPPAGVAMIAIFEAFTVEWRKLKRTDDQFAEIRIGEVDAGALLVARWRELVKREEVDPPRERIEARKASPEDEIAAQRSIAWQQYRYDLPSLVVALNACHPKSDYLEWSSLSERDLTGVPTNGHPHDVPPAFDLALGRRSALRKGARQLSDFRPCTHLHARRAELRRVLKRRVSNERGQK